MHRAIVAEWLGKITEPGVRRRSEFYYQQPRFGCELCRRTCGRELLREQEPPCWKRLCQDFLLYWLRFAPPYAGHSATRPDSAPIGTVDYSGFGIDTPSSGPIPWGHGRPRASEETELHSRTAELQSRLKNVFKVRRSLAASKPGSVADFYPRLLPSAPAEMARLTCHEDRQRSF